jgi:predicted GH43/DUF377 family glycosyl hydrolase
MIRRVRLWLLLAIGLAGCGRYADFSLPPQPGGAAHFRFEWHARPEPVLTRGAAGTWDATDLLNPSVVIAAGQYLNFYSGYDGKTWRTGKAISSDGLAWTKTGKVPDSAIGANGSAVEFRGSILYYYQAGDPPTIGLAREAALANGNAAVLKLGPYGSWDERGVADPYVVEASGKLYMFYLGMDRARRQRIGLAVSKDGEQWVKLRANPILQLGEYGSFDENGLGEPAVWASDGFYWMLYTGRSRVEQRKLGLARSTDGVRWEKLPGVIAGEQTWDKEVMCDPSVLVEAGRIRVWFGGGDKRSPDQNLDGQIGYGELKLLPGG